MENLNTCGCCEGISQETPVRIENRPGLTAIAYRTGTYAQFRESLLAALSDNRFTALRALTTRNNDDFTIALLDAWAVVSDVFTFYQERIANESYLNTATEQRSVLELSRLIGYELSPGVAATTFLAFTIEDNSLTQGQIHITGNQRALETPAPSIIPVGTRVQSIPGPDEMPQFFETIEPLEARASWNAIKPKMGLQQTDLANTGFILVVDGINNDLKPNDLLLIIENNKETLRSIVRVEINETDKNTRIYMAPDATFRSFTESANAPTSSGKKIPQAFVVNKAALRQLQQYYWKKSGQSTLDKSSKRLDGLSKKVAPFFPSPILPSNDGVYVFRKRAAAFGYNAQLFYQRYDDNGNPVDLPTKKEWNLDDSKDKKIYLDSVYDGIEVGSYMAFKKPNGTQVWCQVSEVAIHPHTAYGISSKCTVVTTNRDDNWQDGAANLGDIRPITFFVQSEKLKLTTSPITSVVSKNTLTLSVTNLGLKAGMHVIAFGEVANKPGTFDAEHLVLDNVEESNDATTVVFKNNLSHNYIRSSFSINANVAEATHGETVREVLGSGDASRIFQKFELKQSPLTFVGSTSATGTKSTLEIRVNDVLWKEVPSLFGMGPNDHVFITRRDDNAKTTVTFGDGITGSRLPTGQDNVRAVYRKGLGADGLVKADQLSQLVSRPLGVKAVTNPNAPEGAQDRERLADARRNATSTIFTLGRVVSLQDYEDFARAFAGIAKSLATLTWHGQKQRIFLTVAGQNGEAVEPGSTLYNNLMTALQEAGIPGVPVEIQPYEARFFRLEGSIAVHPDYLPDNVVKAVDNTLRSQFSFESRSFGQGVALSEVMAVIQNVEGVVAVDVDAFYRIGEPHVPNNILPSSAPQPGTDKPIPAELLILDPKPVLLNVMS